MSQKTQLLLLLIGVSAAILMLIGAFFALDSDDSSPKVKVMVALPTGLEIGTEMLNAAQLALDEADGKAGARTVEIVAVDVFDPDDPFSPVPAVAAAEDAIQDKTIVAMLGATSSSTAREVIPLLNPVPLVLVSPAATSPSLTKPGFTAGEPGIFYPTGQRNFYRVTPSDEVQGLVAARWMNQQSVATVYIVNMATPYSEGLAGILEVNAADLGIEIVGREVFNPAEATPVLIEAVVERILTANPDAVYYPIAAGGSGFNLIAALREQNTEILIIGSDGLPAETLPDETTALRNVYATNISVEASQLASAAPFLAAYEAAYGKTPPAFALMTYEAMRAILKAIEEADEPTREGVLEAMEDLGEFSGALGNWHFDEHGDTSLTAISILRLQDGVWETIGVVE